MTAALPYFQVGARTVLNHLNRQQFDYAIADVDFTLIQDAVFRHDGRMKDADDTIPDAPHMARLIGFKAMALAYLGRANDEKAWTAQAMIDNSLSHYFGLEPANVKMPATDAAAAAVAAAEAAAYAVRRIGPLRLWAIQLMGDMYYRSGVAGGLPGKDAPAADVRFMVRASRNAPWMPNFEPFCLEALRNHVCGLGITSVLSAVAIARFQLVQAHTPPMRIPEATAIAASPAAQAVAKAATTHELHLPKMLDHVEGALDRMLVTLTATIHTQLPLTSPPTEHWAKAVNPMKTLLTQQNVPVQTDINANNYRLTYLIAVFWHLNGTNPTAAATAGLTGHDYNQPPNTLYDVSTFAGAAIELMEIQQDVRRRQHTPPMDPHAFFMHEIAFLSLQAEISKALYLTNIEALEDSITTWTAITRHCVEHFRVLNSPTPDRELITIVAKLHEAEARVMTRRLTYEHHRPERMADEALEATHLACTAYLYLRRLIGAHTEQVRIKINSGPNEEKEMSPVLVRPAQTVELWYKARLIMAKCIISLLLAPPSFGKADEGRFAGAKLAAFDKLFQLMTPSEGRDTIELNTHFDVNNPQDIVHIVTLMDADAFFIEGEVKPVPTFNDARKLGHDAMAALSLRWGGVDDHRTKYEQTKWNVFVHLTGGEAVRDTRDTRRRGTVLPGA